MELLFSNLALTTGLIRVTLKWHYNYKVVIFIIKLLRYFIALTVSSDFNLEN